MVVSATKGTSTNVLDIIVGKEFYVCNGDWDGIIEQDGDGTKWLTVISQEGRPRHQLIERDRELVIYYP